MCEQGTAGKEARANTREPSELIAVWDSQSARVRTVAVTATASAYDSHSKAAHLTAHTQTRERPALVGQSQKYAHCEPLCRAVPPAHA